MIRGFWLLVCVLVFSLFLIIFINSNVSALPNPAAAYCKQMGYNYKIEKAKDGSEKGVCIPAFGKEFDEWDFFKGKVGTKYSYCAKKGYDLKVKKEGNNEYAVCVPKGSATTSETAKNMIDLMQENKDYSLKSDVSLETNLPEKVSSNIPLSGGGSLPSYFDWSDNAGINWMTPVKNQGGCGACWAFGAVGAVEAKLNIDFNNPNLDYDLAEQQLISKGDSCCSNCGGCSGGYEAQALNYIRDVGIADESCFPYVYGDGFCNLCSDWQNRTFKITSYHGVANTREDSKRALIDYGPLVVNIESGYPAFESYSGGIFTESSNGGGDHYVDLVGYNDTGQYWIIKNSWGSGWGENGYMRLSYYNTEGNDPIERNGNGYAVDNACNPGRFLQPYIITTSLNVTKNKFFNFSVGVRCVGGDCGDVSGLLDPINDLGNGTYEIYYDDNPASYLPWDTYFAVRFNSTFGSSIIRQAKLMLSGKGSCSSSFANFSLYVYDDNNGKPGQILYTNNEITAVNSWVLVNIPNITTNEYFWIGFKKINLACIYTDNSGVGRSYNSFDGILWYSLNNDLAIRAIVSEGLYKNKEGIISTINGATPFYTISPQPQTCLDMHAGDTCEKTWQVNATGAVGLYKFFGIFSSSFPFLLKKETSTVDIKMICTQNSDCGIDGWVGSTNCNSDDVFQNWRNWTCNNPGQTDVSCSYSDTLQLKTDCGEDSCENWGGNYCKSENVYHNQTCYDLGCGSGACFNNSFINETLVQNCGTGCELGKCRGNIWLLTPGNNGMFSRNSPALFSFGAISNYTSFKIEVSATPDFKKKTNFGKIAKYGKSYQATTKDWDKLMKFAKKYSTNILYWRIYGTGKKVKSYSNVYKFSLIS